MQRLPFREIKSKQLRFLIHRASPSAWVKFFFITKAGFEEDGFEILEIGEIADEGVRVLRDGLQDGFMVPWFLDCSI